MASKRALAFLVCLLTCAGCAKAPPEDHTKTFQGTWNTFDANGKKLGSTAIFTKDIMELLESRAVLSEIIIIPIEKTAFRVDKSKTPAHIDFVFLDGDNAGQTKLGIYVFENDTLKICVADLDAVRPTDFAAGEKRQLLVLKREP